MRAPLLLALGATALLYCSGARAGTKEEEERESLRGVQRHANCVIQASFSFLYPVSYPPKNETELKALCKSQAEAFKCIKDKMRNASPLLRRGLVSYATGRGRYNKKYCTNTASEPARKFLEATKCVMEKRFEDYHENDSTLVQTLNALLHHKFNDSSVELKQICCTFYRFHKNILEMLGPECAAHKAMIEEMAGQIVSDDMNLVCDDDEKMAKICSKLEPIQFKRVANYQPDERLPSPFIAMYLLTTLGEPNDLDTLTGGQRR